MNEEIKTTEAQAAEGTTTPEGGNTPTQEAKTFTQDDVNRIVQERLAKERAKAQPAPDPLAVKEKELAKREFLLDAKETLRGKGFNAELLGALNATNKETLEASLAIIEKVYGDSKRPLPRIVAPSGGGGGSAPDPIRTAMGLPKR